MASPAPARPDSMLPGEIVVAKASKAQQTLYYTEGSEYPGIRVSGTLTCTNYCFSFVMETKPRQKKLGHYASCQLAASRQVPLGCVKELNMIVNGRRKLLDGRTSLPKKITEVEIICKDLRRLVFSVRHCAKNEASTILNALARHTHPSTVSLLFAFDHARAIRERRESLGTSSTPSFLSIHGWQKELTRLGVSGDQWRVSKANKEFLICDSLCPYIVVPASISDGVLDYVASLHRGNRLPIWCWSHPHTGVSLTRGAASTIDDQSEAPDPNYMYAVSMARHINYQVENKRTESCDVTRRCGTVLDIRTAFYLMQELCMPDTFQDLSSLDRKWLTGLDGAGWPTIVRSCLQLAKEVAQTICIHRTPVFLHEEEGRDLSAVVSSLVQLMVDPFFRSISGFESLIQKEWVALGHPFTARHGLVTTATQTTSEESVVEAPTFLLFLDCVWQLSLQFPSAFEFSEFYLLHLHNATHSCLHGTFIFNSPKARLQASLQLKSSMFFGSDEGVDPLDYYEGLLPSSWGRWRDHLSKEEREHCLNPFYYIFGSSDARFDYHTSDPLPMSNHFSSIFNDTTPNLTMGGSYGLYSGQQLPDDTPPTPSGKDYYQMGLLLPETSMCSVRPWLGFFTRYIPDFREHLPERRVVREREGRLVKDVRRLKDTLNELELSVGTATSDLTSFIGEVLAAREWEKQMQRQFSIEANIPHRPRLSAIVIPFDEDEEREGTSRSAKTLPPRLRSLAEFTETLYRFREEEDTPSRLKKTAEPSNPAASLPSPAPSGSSTGSGRSPITKTRLRVTRTESTDPSMLSSRWQGPSGSQPTHIPLLPNKILIRSNSNPVGDEEEEEEEEEEEDVEEEETHELTEL